MDAGYSFSNEDAAYRSSPNSFFQYASKADISMSLPGAPSSAVRSSATVPMMTSMPSSAPCFSRSTESLRQHVAVDGRIETACHRRTIPSTLAASL